jgi:hypothetical protein
MLEDIPGYPSHDAEAIDWESLFSTYAYASILTLISWNLKHALTGAQMLS